jgi:GDP-4-dehydro-6-deoxy-D-mannose reductase
VTAGPILVTGAAGFVGTHLLAQLGEEAQAFEGDVLDAAALERALQEARPSALVHLAALTSVADSWNGPAEVWQVNAIGTVNVLDAVRSASPAARVLFASTGEVYGRAEEIPTTEESPVAPLSPYAASKAAAELACFQAREGSGLDVVVARPFQHEGPGRDARFALGSWAQQLAELEEKGGGTLKVGDLSARRDITDVRDVCRAYQALLDPNVPAATYNIASGRAVAMSEVLQLLLGLVRCPVEVEQDPERFRPAELPVVCGDSSRLRSATGWQPEIPLEQTVADALDYARKTLAQEAAGT